MIEDDSESPPELILESPPHWVYQLRLGEWVEKYMRTIICALEESIDQHGDCDDQGASAGAALKNVPKK